MKKVHRIIIVGIWLIMSGLSSEVLCGDVDYQSMIKQSNIDPYHYVRKKKDKGKIDKQWGVLQKLQTTLCCNDYNGVEQLLKDKVNPNALLGNKKFPLECVRDSKIAQLLIRYDALVNQKNKLGQTPLFNAINNQYFDVARILLRHGANINEKDNEGNNLLDCAIKTNNKEGIKFLLYHGVDITQYTQMKNDVSLQRRCYVNGFDETVFYYEERKILPLCEEEINDRVLQAGLIELNGKECSSLSLLANNGEYLKQILKLNCNGYCSSDIRKLQGIFYQYSEVLWKELQANYSPYNKEVVQLARLIGQRFMHHNMLLYHLEQKNFIGVKIWLKQNPYLFHISQEEKSTMYWINFYCINYFLHNSFFSSEYKEMKELLYSGSLDLDVFDQNGEFLLSYVIQNSDDGEKYKDILKNGVSVNAPDDSGKTPLWYALIAGNYKKIMTLVKYGAVVEKCMLNSYYKKELTDIFNQQKCFVCDKHPDDMSNIPCINRHIGNYICYECYYTKGQQCPICRRRLDLYGM